MIKCAKLNGNGNDFIALNNMDMTYDTDFLCNFAVMACRRMESVGADGILVAEPSATQDFKMRIINRDGSEGEMCGNGARCIARFAFENGIVKKPEMTFETLGGPVHAEVRGCMTSLDLSPVSLENAVVGGHGKADGYEFDYTFLTVGVPHTVIFCGARDKSDEEYRDMGRALRNATALFPEGTNVNFVFPRTGKKNELDVLTYERGVEDLTLSCGTGSTASAIAAMTLGYTGPVVDVYNPGGLNRVSLSFASERVLLPVLEGAVVYVADLEMYEDALK
ncbi:diaminopimelate epimerase [Synergistaceae bacterium OttesenSCG-928-D05]|nr:diaminopimelate epimerase [Synergistaceae bacterium OttesenSCG-928-D05]